MLVILHLLNTVSICPYVCACLQPRLNDYFGATGPNDPRFFPSNPFNAPFGGPGYVLLLFH